MGKNSQYKTSQVGDVIEDPNAKKMPMPTSLGSSLGRIGRKDNDITGLTVSGKEVPRDLQHVHHAELKCSDGNISYYEIYQILYEAAL